MASLLVRNLDDDVKDYLRMRAALRGSSMEEEVRCILRDVAVQQPLHDLVMARLYGEAAVEPDSVSA